MPNFDALLAAEHYAVLKQFRRTADRSIALVQSPEGNCAVWRCYDRPVSAYEKLVGTACDELPRVYRYTALEDGGCLVEEEYIDGISLAELIEDHCMDESQTAAITQRVCRALAVLHTQDMVHRDVKPENILITAQGRVTLIDLDAVAPQSSDKDRDTRLLGTVGYAAPEQYGFGHSDARADVFGLGVLMNVLLTGQHPARQLAEGNLRKVIEKCIAVNVDQRYAAVEQIMEQLPEQEPRRCPDCGFLSPGEGCIFCGTHGKTHRKKRGAWIAGILAVLILAAGAAGVLLRPDDSIETPIPTDAPGIVEPSPVPTPVVTPEATPTPAQPDVQWIGISTMLTDGTFLGEPVAVDFEESNRLTSGSYTIHNCTAQEMNNGHLRFDMEFTAPAGMWVTVFNTPDGNRLMHRAGEETSGKRERIRFDLEQRLFPEIGEVVVSFSSGEAGSFLVNIPLAEEEPEVTPAPTPTPTPTPTPPSTSVYDPPYQGDLAPLRAPVLSDGNPVGEPIQMPYLSRNELTQGTYAIHQYTAQVLDNGNTRFALEFTAPALMQITVFNPPAGSLFRYSDKLGAPGERKTFAFELSEAELDAITDLTITFSNTEKYGRFLVTSRMSEVEDVRNLAAGTLQQERFPWTDDPEVYGTMFRYDLDGDGVREEYIFGGMFDFAGTHGLLRSIGDTVRYDDPETLSVAPAVWRRLGAGVYEPVWEFASLLTRTGVALRRMTAAAEKEFEPVGALYGMWTGAYRAVFDTAGQWQYEFTAQLEGETLSATGITRADVADSNSNLSQSEEEAVPITFHPVYSGGEVSPLTPFSYDLDGNGAEEEYYLGFLRDDLPGKEYQNRIVVKQLQQGKTVTVRVAPVVWKRDVDGTLTVERMFAPLLQETEVTLYEYDEAGGVLSVKKTDALYGIWKGAVELGFAYSPYTTNWVIEASSMLGGKKLSVSAMVSAGTKGNPAPLQPILTDETPLGDAVGIPFTTNDELILERYSVYGCTAQKLSNNYLRFSIDFEGPEGLIITVFSPPDGVLFRMTRNEVTSGKRETLVFDVAEEKAKNEEGIAASFSYEDGRRFLVHLMVPDEL